MTRNFGRDKKQIEEKKRKRHEEKLMKKKNKALGLTENSGEPVSPDAAPNAEVSP